MLLLAGIALLISEVVTFRKAMTTNLVLMADVLGDNSTAALSFNDEPTARQTLASLHHDPHIVAATLFTLAGAQLCRIYAGR